MRKTINLILFILLLSFVTVKAECNDEEIYNYIKRVNINYLEYSRNNYKDKDGNTIWTGNLPYSYLLVLSEKNDNVIAKAVNNLSDDVSVAEDIVGYNVYAIGCQNNLEDIIYTVNLYGSEKSSCPNELLKTVNVRVSGFNQYMNTTLCDQNPDNELCAAHASTSNITYEEFKEALEKKNIDPKSESRISGTIIYLLYIIIPLFVIIIYYEIKIKNFKKIEGKK